MGGRKLKADRPVKRQISLPETLAARVELALFDPVRGRREYGALSQLIESLLREWLRNQGVKL